MNCADSTERPLKLPEPVFHCVDMIQEVPDTIKFLKEKHRIIGGRHYLQ